MAAKNANPPQKRGELHQSSLNSIFDITKVLPLDTAVPDASVQLQVRSNLLAIFLFQGL